MGREKNTKHAQWLRDPYSFTEACTPLMPLRRLVTVRSTTELPSPAAVRPTLALWRSRPITRPRLGRWTLSTAIGRASVAARQVLCSPLALSSTSHRPRRWLRRRVLARSWAVHLGSCREGCSGARALRVLPRPGSGTRRDCELRAARFWPNLFCAELRGSGRLPLRLSLVERRAPTPLLTATWRVPRTRGTRLASTSTAVPRPSCKLEAGHHRGSWR